MIGDKTVCLDWDGTCVENKWPDMGDWMPGAVEAIERLHHSGLKLIVFSARLSPINPFLGTDRPPIEVMVETDRVRGMLDEAGLYYVDIWTSAGKPGAFVYVDDRAERYHGRPGSWAKLAEKIILRAGQDIG